ncbi:MAG: MiaB/RimO family radical SAM methylthiotransferase [Gemmatimonadota bacterium]|nr:MiaB/RimO family radical SAM methylthiotransferase [Gemmatimonadota bacterium]
MNDTPTVWFHTFGCKANQYDTERMRHELEGRGARAVAEAGDADVAVVNTCTVTNQADANARHLVRRLRRRHPGLTIVVAGCSTAFRESSYREMDEIDGVVPGQDPVRIAEALAGLGHVGQAEAAPGLLDRNARGTRAWLKVQDGCDRKCSFCATRIARGGSVSRPVEDVVEEARGLARVHPELVITGIHIGHYGHDLEPPTTLAALCARLLEAVPARLRLSSIEATEIDDDLLALLAESGGQLAPHLHVPLQSGSDRVLRLMRRWHTREAYRRRVHEIAERLPRLGLGADVIVGFPGEGEDEFAETRALIEELPYTYLHVFPYSVRDGTVAASLPDLVPGDVAAARSRELRDRAREKGRAYEKARAGEWADIVVEGNGERPTGVTGDYLRVEVVGRPEVGGRFRGRLERPDGRLVAEAPA